MLVILVIYWQPFLFVTIVRKLALYHRGLLRDFIGHSGQIPIVIALIVGL